MGREKQLLQILNDGEFHSGETLAEALGVSRAAIWKLVRALSKQGVDVHAVRRRGYRLAEPLEYLDKAQILVALAADARDLVANLEIHEWIDSTNTYLMNGAKYGLASGSVCLAEAQSGGRGRQGRSWVSPYATNLYLSLLWRFPMAAPALTGLSLVTGVAVARALQGLGVTEIGLKWPNDVVWRYRKLGGILLEFGGESSGPCHIVAGVGLNVAMPSDAARDIDQPWVDLRRILGPGRVSRNRLAARMIGEMVMAFAQFERHGLDAVSEEWKRLDLAMGHRILLSLPNTKVNGIARGVDWSGALLVETTTGIQRFLGGEISLRIEE